MDLRVQKRTAELLYYLLTQKNEEAARIPFTPGKLLLAQEMPQSSRLERATPESQGVRSAYIQQFLEELEQDPRMHPHSVLLRAESKRCHYRRGGIRRQILVVQIPTRSRYWHSRQTWLCGTITRFSLTFRRYGTSSPKQIMIAHLTFWRFFGISCGTVSVKPIV